MVYLRRIAFSNVSIARSRGRSNNIVATINPASNNWGKTGTRASPLNFLTTTLNNIAPFRQQLDVCQRAQMHVTGNVTRPPIKVPKGPHVQSVPTATDQCGRAIIVIDKLELSAMHCEMAQKLGIVRLFHDLEGQETHRRYLGNSVLKNQAVGENTFSRR